MTGCLAGIAVYANANALLLSDTSVEDFTNNDPIHSMSSIIMIPHAVIIIDTSSLSELVTLARGFEPLVRTFARTSD